MGNSGDKFIALIPSLRCIMSLKTRRSARGLSGEAVDAVEVLLPPSDRVVTQLDTVIRDNKSFHLQIGFVGRVRITANKCNT